MALTDLEPAQLADIHEGIHTLNEAGRYDEALVKAHDLVADAMKGMDLTKAWPPKKKGKHAFADNGSGKCKDCGAGKGADDHDADDVDKSAAVTLDPTDENWMRRVAKAMVGFLKDEVDETEEDPSRPFA